MDQAKLKEFEVTDCPQTVHSHVHLVIGAFCEMSVATKAHSACDPFNGAACKAAVDSAAKDFDLDDMPKSNKEAGDNAGAEAHLGLFHACATAVSKVLESEGMSEQMSKVCSPGGNLETDEARMTAMGMDDSHCVEYFKTQWLEFATFICDFQSQNRDDRPRNMEDATVEWMKKSATEYAESLQTDSEHRLEMGMDKLGSSMLPQQRLRLFQIIRDEKWPGRLRWWSPTTIAATSVASALVLAASLNAAWRCRSAGHEPRQDSEPILDSGANGQDMQPVA